MASWRVGGWKIEPLKRMGTLRGKNGRVEDWKNGLVEA